MLLGVVALDYVSADVTYYEKDGMVVGEGEIYSSRTYKLSSVNTVSNSWYIMLDEDVGAGSITNARRGAYIQALPDNGVGGSPNGPPEITDKMYISTPGTYRLYLRRDGDGTDSNTIGTTDSIL